MSETIPLLRRRATQMLILATLFWGISFPVMKAIAMLQRNALSQEDTWFATSSAVLVRFGIAGLVMLAWSWRTLRQMRWLEVWQGLGLGICAGAGMIFQVDGLNYTSASVSAFLTQCGCLILPWAVAARDRRWPSPMILVCSSMAAVGVAVLADVDWRSFRMGRGELETLISSVIFAAQILWLERPLFARNRVSHFTLVMFLTMSLISLPVALGTTGEWGDWAVAYGSRAVLGLILVLVVFCTLISFVLMNRWQRLLPAPEAGLIYAAEPVFASLFALFLPAWLSLSMGIAYANEQLTGTLLVGGGLISLANILIQVRTVRSARAAPALVQSLPPPRLAPPGSCAPTSSPGNSLLRPQ